MNILKRLFMNNKMHSSDKTIQLPSGQLYLVRSPNSPKSENECLYDDAIISIRETNSAYNYELAISKSLPTDQDADGNDLEDDPSEDGFDTESTTLKAFHIDDQLKICLFHETDREVLGWKDLEGDIGDSYEYRINPTVSQDTIDQFMLAIYKCEYEFKYRKSSSKVRASKLREFVFERDDIEPESGSVLSSAASTPFRKGKTIKPEVSEDSESDDFEDAEEEPEAEGKLIGTISCDLFEYVPEKKSFSIADKGATLKLFDLGHWEFKLVVGNKKSGSKVISITVNDTMDPTFRFEQLCFVFNYVTDKCAVTYLAKFPEPKDYDIFQTLFARSAWEHENKCKWVSSKKSDEDYLVDAMGDVSLNDEDMSDFNSNQDSEDEEEDSGVESSYNVKKNIRRASTSDEDELEDSDDSEINTGLKIGLKDDMAFISRGNKLGVFTTDDRDRQLKFNTSIEGISSYKDRTHRVNPDRMMLQNGDSTMIIQDKTDPNTIHKMDLTRGEIVEDWNLRKDGIDIPVRNFAPNSKYAELTGDQTFLGLSNQSLFKVDPRIRDKIVDSQFKQYKTKTGFTQMATTGDGYIAAATANGEIKLYDVLGKNAKTALPGLGDEFIGLTTSNDGRFLLATCKTYLLLIDVKIKRGRYRYKLGFERSFSKDDKPLPIKLSLRPEHLAYLRQVCGNSFTFTKANFNTSVTSKAKYPTSIITSIGPFAITWNLRKVLRNDPEPYTIRRYNDTVMMGDFTVHNNQRMILTLPEDVTLVSTRSFKKPEDAFNVVKEYGK